jgi:predicted lipoprotein with Yx(FWY)xxD motif
MKRSISLLALAAVSTLVLLAAGPIGSASSAANPTRAKVGTGRSSLGRILVNGSGRTLYLFEKDTRGRSSCRGQCASYWPPLLTTGRPVAGTGVNRSLLGTTRRPDGKTQVTYAGHPLYRFVQDRRAGDTSGEDLRFFGAAWYVVSPSGKKIEADE